jgi:hypothetical protein
MCILKELSYLDSLIDLEKVKSIHNNFSSFSKILYETRAVISEKIDESLQKISQ